MDRKAPLIYDTLSDMTNDANIVGGMIVKTLGETVIGDGNGRIFKVYDDTMGVPYDETKHIRLKKANTYAEKVEDNPLYKDIRDLDDRIDEIGHIDIDTKYIEKTYKILAEMQTDSSIKAGMTVKTLGRTSIGDGEGKTYNIVYHTPGSPYEDGQVPLDNTSCAAVAIVASYYEALSTYNANDINDLRINIKEDQLTIFDTLTELINSNDISIGMTVKTLGNVEIDDGAGALYKIYNSETGGWLYREGTDIPLKDYPTDGTFAYYIKESAGQGEITTEIINRVNACEELVRLDVENVGRLNDSVNSLSERIDTIDGDIHSVESSVDSLSETVTALSPDLEYLHNGLDNVTADVQSINTTVKNLGTSVSSISSRVTSTENNISSLNDTVNSLQSYAYSAIGNLRESLSSPSSINTLDEFTNYGFAFDKLSNGTIQLVVAAAPDGSLITGAPKLGADGDPEDDSGEDEPPVDPGYTVEDNTTYITLTINLDTTEYTWVVPNSLYYIPDDVNLMINNNSERPIFVKRHIETKTIVDPDTGESYEVYNTFIIFTINKAREYRVIYYV